MLASGFESPDTSFASFHDLINRVLIRILYRAAKTCGVQQVPEAVPASPTGIRYPSFNRSYSALVEKAVLGPSGEVLGGITRLNDPDSGVVFGFFYRGFQENGRHVICFNTCIARTSWVMRARSQRPEVERCRIAKRMPRVMAVSWPLRRPGWRRTEC